jgi:hypothetical protein
VAANASSVADDAQNGVGQLQSATEANSKAIAALDEKIERMFRKPLSKQSVTAE